MASYWTVIFCACDLHSCNHSVHKYKTHNKLYQHHMRRGASLKHGNVILVYPSFPSLSISLKYTGFDSFLILILNIHTTTEFCRDPVQIYYLKSLLFRLCDTGHNLIEIRDFVMHCRIYFKIICEGCSTTTLIKWLVALNPRISEHILENSNDIYNNLCYQ